jgi:tetratricopeptide (TPR) repeat protein
MPPNDSRDIADHDDGATPIKPIHRRYGPRPPRKLKDVDASERATKIKAFTWALVVTIIALAASSMAGSIAGASGGVMILLRIGAIGAGVAVYYMTLASGRGMGRVFQQIYHPSGRTTPEKREYSYAQSLEARGAYREAIHAYENAVLQFGQDPEPYIRIARIYRDQLKAFHEAAQWLRRARSDADIDAGRELVVTQELVELYRDKLDAPNRAIPELARIVERFGEHPAAAAARKELDALRRQLWSSDAPDNSAT